MGRILAKKPGRPSKYDGWPLERLLQILSDHPELGVEPASLLVAHDASASNPRQYAEGLRKRFRVRRDRGDLPTKEHPERARSEEIRETAEALLQAQAQNVERSKVELDRVERELRELGVDPDTENLRGLIESLRERHDYLSILEEFPPDLEVRVRLSSGIYQTADEVQKASERDTAELKRIRRVLRLLGDLRIHRGLLRSEPRD